MASLPDNAATAAPSITTGGATGAGGGDGISTGALAVTGAGDEVHLVVQQTQPVTASMPLFRTPFDVEVR